MFLPLDHFYIDTVVYVKDLHTFSFAVEHRPVDSTSSRTSSVIGPKIVKLHYPASNAPNWYFWSCTRALLNVTSYRADHGDLRENNSSKLATTAIHEINCVSLWAASYRRPPWLTSRRKCRGQAEPTSPGRPGRGHRCSTAPSSPDTPDRYS